MTNTQDFISAAVREAEDFIKGTGIAESTFGMRAVNDATVIERLRNGQVTLRTVAKIQSYIRDNRIYPNKRQQVIPAEHTAKMRGQ